MEGKKTNHIIFCVHNASIVGYCGIYFTTIGITNLSAATPEAGKRRIPKFFGTGSDGLAA